MAKLNNEIQPTTKVLTFTWYVADNWYGKNYRVVLLKEDSAIDFASAKEAKTYRSKLVRYIKANYRDVTSVRCKDMKFGQYAAFPTYTYCSMGPSYSCTNILITVEQLEQFISEQESSYEWQQKQRELELKKEHRRQAKNRKH